MGPPRGTTTSRWSARPGNARVEDAHGARPQGPQGRGGGRDLVHGRGALPGHEHAARRDEREGHLDQVGQGGHGPDGHRRPALAVARVGRERLSPGLLGGRRRLQPDGPDDRPQELDLLAHRVHEQNPLGAQRSRQRQARKAAAAAEVEEAPDAEAPKERHGGEAVEHVGPCHIGRLADRGQVDRVVPGEQQADVAVDRCARARGQVDPLRRQPRLEGVLVRGREWREVRDARRERSSRPVQGTLLWSNARPAREPLPA